MIVLGGLVIGILLWSMFAKEIRSAWASLRGDWDEVYRLNTTYEDAELLAQKDFKVDPDVFELTWNEMKESDFSTLPYDVYIYFRSIYGK
jgi:hypothetical protein